jgi:hypothetical protein
MLGFESSAAGVWLSDIEVGLLGGYAHLGVEQQCIAVVGTVGPGLLCSAAVCLQD